MLNISLPYLNTYLQGVKMASKWWETQEKAGRFWLKVTLVLTRCLPYFLLKKVAMFIGFIFFCFAPSERKNIAAFRNNIQSYLQNNTTLKPEELKNAREQLEKTSVLSNFLEFAIALCDKFLVWQNKIPFEVLEIKDKENVVDRLITQKKGQILLASHFGNIDVVRSFALSLSRIRLVILMYSRHSVEFMRMINEISHTQLEIIEVDSLDVEKMLEIKKVLDEGGHVAVMGDRVGLNETKVSCLEFLGKTCVFPQGVFLLAGLLKVPLSTIWCYKQDNKYILELQEICSLLPLGRNKEESIYPYMQIYSKQLENKVLNYPTQWFNFYDFWRRYD